MALKATIAQWLGALGILGILVALITDWKLPAEWVSAVATAVLAIAAVFGLAGVLWPIQEERRKRRRVHFGELKTNVLQLVSQELTNTKGILSRRSPPIQWINAGVGLQVIATPAPDQPNPEEYKHLYDHTKTYHYAALLGRYEIFMTEYKQLLEELLALAKDLEARLASASNLFEDDLKLNSACFHGSLATFVFFHLWHPHYFPLDVVRERTNVEYGWVLKYSMTSYAHGTEEEMRALSNVVDQLIRNEDRSRYTDKTDKFKKRLEKLLLDLAAVTSSDKLAGECDSTQD